MSSYGFTNLLHQHATGRYVYSKPIAEWKNNSIQPTLERHGGDVSCRRKPRARRAPVRPSRCATSMSPMAARRSCTASASILPPAPSRHSGLFRLRQDHAPARVCGFVPVTFRLDPSVGDRDVARCPGKARHGDGVPVLRAVAAHDRAAKHRLWAEAAGRHGPRSRQGGFAARDAGARAATRSARSRRCPAGSASASRSAGRWRSIPASCCSTSRCPISTPRSA